MADKTLRENFFESLANGAKWDVGVSINRTNPLPLDQYSVFESETKLEEYINGAFSYPGQTVAVVTEDEVKLYYLAPKADNTGLEKKEVGAMPGVDNKSIKIKTDETTGEEILTLVGLDTATTGASLVKLADGSVGWSSMTQEGLTADLTGIKTDISELNTTVYGIADGSVADTGLTSKVAALENKFAALGGIFNFQGSFTVGDNETIDDKIDFVPKNGDVVLINGKQEYVYVDGNWEPFGDPHGVEELANTVNRHTTQITGLTTRVSNLETAVGKEAEGEAEATGLYAYVDSVATTKANAAQSAAEATAAAALSPVADQVKTNKNNIAAHNTAINLKADTTYVNEQISAVKSEVAKKAVKTEVEAALDLKADKTTVANDLALKADKSTFETVTNGHGTRISAAEEKIASLEGTVGKTGEGLVGRIETLESTDITHGQEINGLKQNLGTDADLTTKDDTGNYKNTAFGQAGKAQTLATAAKTAAETAQAAAEKAQGTANEAKSAAGAAQSKADQAYELAGTKVTQSDYDIKVKSIENAIQANHTAISTKAEKAYVDEELAKKVDKTTYEAKISEINDAIALKADTETVNGALATKADKTATETAIKAIEDKIGTLGNVMNFVGELTEDDEGNISLAGKTPENGDVGYIGAFEYVYIVTGEGETAIGKWEKFGDTSAESGRISALETVVGNNNSGLVKDVADLKVADTIITGNITALSTSVDSRFAAVNETLTNLSNNKADKTALAAEKEAREAAIKAEEDARIADVDAEEKARIAAISALDTYVKSALAWGTF